MENVLYEARLRIGLLEDRLTNAHGAVDEMVRQGRDHLLHAALKMVANAELQLEIGRKDLALQRDGTPV